MLDEGVDAKEHIMPISDSIFIMAYALQLDGKEDSTEHRKLRSAMLVLVDCSERRFIWHKADAITIDNAIDICVSNWTRVPSDTLQEAMNHILGTIR
jgi:hypothetical protein